MSEVSPKGKYTPLRVAPSQKNSATPIQPSTLKKPEVKTPTPFTQERVQRNIIERAGVEDPEVRERMKRTFQLHSKLYREAGERNIAILDEETESSNTSSPLIKKTVRFAEDTPQVKLMSPAASQYSQFESASRREDKRMRETAKDKIMRCAQEVQEFKLPLKKADILYEREYGAIKTKSLMQKMERDDETLLHQEITQLKRNQELLKDEIESLKRQEARAKELRYGEQPAFFRTEPVEMTRVEDHFKLSPNHSRQQEFLQEWRSLSQKQRLLIESTEMGRKLNQSKEDYISDSEEQEEWLKKFDKLEKMQKRMIEHSNTLEFDAKMSATKEKEAVERKYQTPFLSILDDNISKVNGSYGGTLDEADFSRLQGKSKLSFFGTARELNFSRSQGLRTLSSTSDLKLSRQDLGLKRSKPPPVQNRESGLAGIEAQIAGMRSYFKQRKYQEQVMSLNNGSKSKAASLGRPPRFNRNHKPSLDLNIYRTVQTPSRPTNLSSCRPMRGSVTRMSINTSTSLLSYNAKVLSARTPISKNKEAYLNILRGGSPSPIWKPNCGESPMSCNSPLFSDKFSREFDSVQSEMKNADL